MITHKRRSPAVSRPGIAPVDAVSGAACAGTGYRRPAPDRAGG
ncbi:hypothetical protein ACH4JS_21225 [Streptomyces sp. NPDC017638]